jgi:Lar family restriction alleviation protein
MTNGEKFKTAEERAIAFRKFCANKICKGLEANCIFSDKLHDKINHMCEFAWLDLECNEELLPCPFCGGEARIIDLEDPEYKYYQIRCSKCMCKTATHLGMEATIAAWNRRAK